MIKIITLIIVSIFYFIIFPLNIGTITENTYGIFILLSLFIYLLCWIIPIIYFGIKKNLSLKMIGIITGLNVILVISFFVITESPYGMEIRQARQKRVIEWANMHEEVRKAQESFSGSIQNSK